MTDKQKRFITEFLVDLNATQAAIRAGYSRRTAYSIGQENLKKPEIRQAIDTAMKEREARTEITADYVLTNLREIVDRCMQKQPVFTKGEQATDEQGRAIWTFNARDAIKALELLGKNLGLFIDKPEIKADTNYTLFDLMREEFGE